MIICSGLLTFEVRAQESNSPHSITFLPQQFFDGLQNTQFEYYYFGGQKVYLPYQIKQRNHD